MGAIDLELAALLDPYRDRESREDLAVVLDDPAAIRLLAAWRLQSPVWKRPKGKPPAEVGRRWAWIWSGVHYDREGLAAAAKTTEAAAELMLRSCMASRVAYPDGTISGPAAELLAELVQRRYPSGKRSGRPPGVRDNVKRAAAARARMEDKDS